jgi:hypothetical protein
MENNISAGRRIALSESEKKAKWIKTAKWIYWVVTIAFGGTMLIAGVMLLAGAAPNIEGITRLGYPLYVCKILGVAKILGSIAILYGRSPMLKEWAYAGYSFNLIGAALSHVFLGDSLGMITTPLIILCLVLISYRQWKTGWM